MLDLDDVLVHSDWARSRGWRTFKRPGADDFLRQLSARFELVRLCCCCKQVCLSRGHLQHCAV